MAKKPKTPLSVEAIKHDDATRKNIPTAEYQSVLAKHEKSSIRIAYQRRNRDLDPQLVWRGKDEQDWSDLVVHAPPLYIQEKVHPKVLIEDLRRQSERRQAEHAKQQAGAITDLFADFNGLPSEAARTEFYQHDAHWANRMILGDSLQVMASLAEREGLRGKVQCIYFDPPYGIKFNSNFQWSTTSRDVKDGNSEHITREPEQVKAFRDTWRDGIHSYLTYLRDRLTVARDLLTDSGSIFVQIGDENVHRVRAVMDEVFGEDNCVSVVSFKKTGSLTDKTMASVCDYLVWYARSKVHCKFRPALSLRDPGDGAVAFRYFWDIDGSVVTEAQANKFGIDLTNRHVAQSVSLSSQHESKTRSDAYVFRGKGFVPPSNRQWSVGYDGLRRLEAASRVFQVGESLRYAYLLQDKPAQPLSNMWTDGGAGSFTEEQVYVVQTATKIVQRCMLMTTDPGDLVLDPTCGSGTTAYVAEQWGRRWITLDTSRVALALARARIMGARYPYYLLADSRDGQLKEAEITRSALSSHPTRGNIAHGFVYERVPHITLKSIANNAEIDVIWDKFEARLEPLRAAVNAALGKKWEEWEIPREAEAKWPAPASKAHADWWQQRIARQKEIDASIAAKADSEYLYDKPYDDKKKVRVAGPFTVESLSPHRVLGVDENDELIDGVREPGATYGERDFVAIILENLKTAGVQQAHKTDKIAFTALQPWPGELICAEGRYVEGSGEKRAAIFIGPEFGTVARPDLVDAAKEAAEAGFDVLITCAFSYDAHASDFAKLGRLPVLKARMNADLHMAEDLKNTGKGNLFVIFGEPDVDVLDTQGNSLKKQVNGKDVIEVANGEQLCIKIKGVDVFHPNTGEVRSDGADGIACWFIDTDYNEESFFVRHAYFLGANDPYKSLKTTLKSEIDPDAWASLNSDTSRPFDKPKSGRIAVKVINHLGDEVMKVFKVGG